MKNKKGFTLIEILGVLIILALILLLTFPKIIGQIKKIKGDISTKEKALILDAIKDYEHDNGNAPKCMSVDKLKSEGYLSNIDLNGYVCRDGEGDINILNPSTLATLPATSLDDSNLYFGHELDRTKVESITIVDSKTVPTGALDSWDASEAKNGSAMAYTMDSDSDSKYELYIGGDGGVQANAVSVGLFAYFENVTSITGLHNLYTDNVTTMYSMFQNCYNLASLDLSSFNTSNVTDMTAMFSECYRLTNINLKGFNTTNVTDMGNMFEGCRALTSLDLSSFNTSNVTDMHYMFRNCSSLTSLDLSHFNTSNVIEVSNVGGMLGMFQNCTSLTSLDVSNFNTSGITDMRNMFEHCTSLTSLDLSSFDTSNVTDMRNMFDYCTNLVNLNANSFNFSSVRYMNWMFGNCRKLVTTLNITKKINYDSYSNWLNSALTEEGALVTLNYTSAAETTVNNMVMSSTNRIVKGNLISQ